MADYYTSDEYDNARNGDILASLQSMGYEFKREGNYYRNERHSSLVVNPSSGKFHWNSKDVHGNQPIELLKQILIHDFHYEEKSAYITAIKRLAGTEMSVKASYLFPLNEKQKKPTTVDESKGDIVLPAKNKTASKATGYLCDIRGLDREIVEDLISQGKIFETKYGHPCFVSNDKNGTPQHAFIRGRYIDKNGEVIEYKKDVKNSDKSSPFVVNGGPESNRIYCFEASIDAISHASLYKLNNLDYKDGHRIGLHGTSFLGLEQFLQDNPQIDEIVACLDNDETGIRRAKKLCAEYKEKAIQHFCKYRNQRITTSNFWNRKNRLQKLNKKILRMKTIMKWSELLMKKSELLKEARAIIFEEIETRTKNEIEHIFIGDCIGIIDELYLKKIIMEEVLEEMVVDYVDLMLENEKLQKELKAFKTTTKALLLRVH